MKAIRVRIKQDWMLSKVSWTDFWIVWKPYIFEITFKWKEYEIVIDDIFVLIWFNTDFWSIPVLLWFILKPSKWISYILHDYLYNNCWFYDTGWHHIPLSKEQCDSILCLGMKEEWAWIWERGLVHLGLSIWGFVAWERCMNEFIKKNQK